MLHDTKAKNLQSFLMKDFSRVSAKVAKEICKKANLYEKARPTRIAAQEADALYKAIKLTKTTQMPCFMYLRYYRYLEHVGVNEDFDAGYRSREKFEEWYKRDPVNLQRKKLLKLDIKEQELKKLEEEIDNQIKKYCHGQRSAIG